MEGSMHSSPPEIMRCALDQRDLWHAALSLQLRTPAGRAVPHDGNTPAWPGMGGFTTAADPANGGQTGPTTGGRVEWLTRFRGTPRAAGELLEPCSPPVVAPVPIRPSPVLGSGSSAFRPTAAGRQQQYKQQQQQHAQQVVQFLASQAAGELEGAQMPAVHRYDGGVTDFAGDGPHTPPRCRVSLAHDESKQQRQHQLLQRQQSKPQIHITATTAGCSRDPLHGLLQAVSFMGMCEGQGASPHLQAVQDTAQADQPPLLQRNVAAAYTSYLSPERGSEPASLPSSPPRTPPHSCPQGRPVPRSPPKNALRVQGGVGKAKSPTLQERLQHQQRTARSSVSSACTGTSSDSTSGHSNGTADGGGVCGGTGASSAAGTGSWTEEDKAALLSIVQEVKPCGAVEWEAVANRLGRWSKGGASAERMFRTLADPQYQKTSNRHGCRLNPRTGTPMHVMVEYALQQLPGHEGNIDAIAKVIEASPEFARQLDYSARPGTKTYPRWKDTLLGCFKAGRYRHLLNTHVKINGKNVYRLVMPLARDAQTQQK